MCLKIHHHVIVKKNEQENESFTWMVLSSHVFGGSNLARWMEIYSHPKCSFAEKDRLATVQAESAVFLLVNG